MRPLHLLFMTILLAAACGDAPSVDDVLDRTASQLDKLGETLAGAADSETAASLRARLTDVGEQLDHLGSDLARLGAEVATDPRVIEARVKAERALDAAVERVRALIDQVREHPEFQSELAQLREVLSELTDARDEAR